MTASQGQVYLLQVQTQTRATFGPLPSGWEMRITNGNRIYFVAHANEITTWDDPRMPSAGDANIPQYKRDFRKKVIYFLSQLSMRLHPGNCHMTVRRSQLFEDAYSEIMRHPANDLKKKLTIKFHGEDALDYGGVGRELFFLMSKEIFNPYYGPNSAVNPEYLNDFKFIGHVIGLAFFINDFWIHFSTLHFTNLTFSIDNDVFGTTVILDLKPDGRDIQVTNEYKVEYVQLYCEWCIEKRVEKQF
ncbi:hypothetical protein HK100_005589 [Physocladia obscura]|uniref:HECT-type E3 ubiquitin transferase n=1 Tax=Physocladia obscura TaxID=109957 RepID=A0AAD5STP9_9FUNG|nr:hypothetical protein HK100_005589 [Physocladia obscura]